MDLTSGPCCDTENQVEGIPAEKPPCTEDTCSIEAVPLNEAGGKLAFKARTVGGNENQLAADEAAGGVIECVYDADGNPLGLNVGLAGRPALLNGVACVDADGDSLYENPIREIRQTDGSYQLGGLPFPVIDNVCESDSGCDVALGEGQTGNTRAACTSLCATLENTSCYPMLMTPTIAIESARLGQAPITYRVTPQINGVEQDPIEVFSGGGGCCETEPAGSGETSTEGGQDTSSGGDPAHTHEGGSHSHDGPSHTHTMTGDGADSVYSGTISPEPVTVQPGESLQYCITTDVIYEADFSGAVDFNVGNVRVCVLGQSIVNATTIAALEAS